MASSSPITTRRLSTMHGAVFNREHENGQNTDTNWQFVVNDGGATATTTNTGIAFTVGNEYEMWITMTAGATSIGWEIHDITAGTSRVGVRRTPTCRVRRPRSTRQRTSAPSTRSAERCRSSASTSRRTRGNRMTVTTIRTATGFAQLGDDGTATLLDLTRQPTGQTRPLTADEAALVTAVLAQSTATAAEVNEATITTRLEQRLTDLTAIIDRPQTTLTDNTVGSIRQAIRDLQSEVKTLARVDRLQTRRLIRLLDGTD
jgi:hypothetical protein